MKRKLTDKEFDLLVKETDNDFVEDFDINTYKFTYTRDFYIQLGILIEREHCTAREAFKKMGFNTDVLSNDQINSAAHYAKKRIKEKGYTVNPGNYDGSIEPEKMQGLTMEEELAYLKARNMYLETMVDLFKKKRLLLTDAITSLKNKGLM